MQVNVIISGIMVCVAVAAVGAYLYLEGGGNGSNGMSFSMGYKTTDPEEGPVEVEISNDMGNNRFSIKYSSDQSTELPDFPTSDADQAGGETSMKITINQVVQVTVVDGTAYKFSYEEITPEGGSTTKIFTSCNNADDELAEGLQPFIDAMGPELIENLAASVYKSDEEDNTYVFDPDGEEGLEGQSITVDADGNPISVTLDNGEELTVDHFTVVEGEWDSAVFEIPYLCQQEGGSASWEATVDEEKAKASALESELEEAQRRRLAAKISEEELALFDQAMHRRNLSPAPISEAERSLGALDMPGHTYCGPDVEGYEFGGSPDLPSSFIDSCCAFHDGWCGKSYGNQRHGANGSARGGLKWYNGCLWGPHDGRPEHCSCGGTLHGCAKKWNAAWSAPFRNGLQWWQFVATQAGVSVAFGALPCWYHKAAVYGWYPHCDWQSRWWGGYCRWSWRKFTIVGAHDRCTLGLTGTGQSFRADGWRCADGSARMGDCRSKQNWGN
jgi:hypothetical protein